MDASFATELQERTTAVGPLAQSLNPYLSSQTQTTAICKDRALCCPSTAEVVSDSGPVGEGRMRRPSTSPSARHATRLTHHGWFRSDRGGGAAKSHGRSQGSKTFPPRDPRQEPATDHHEQPH